MVKNTTTIGELAELIKQYQQVEAELKTAYKTRRRPGNCQGLGKSPGKGRKEIAYGALVAG